MEHHAATGRVATGGWVPSGTKRPGVTARGEEVEQKHSTGVSPKEEGPRVE